jgi:hypothetical protein
LNGTYCAAYLPSDPNDDTFNPQSTSLISVDYDEYFAITVTGYTPASTTQIGTCYLDFAIECDLISAAKALSYPDICTQGGKTL